MLSAVQNNAEVVCITETSLANNKPDIAVSFQKDRVSLASWLCSGEAFTYLAGLVEHRCSFGLCNCRSVFKGKTVMGHFRVAVCLGFELSLGAQLL